MFANPLEQLVGGPRRFVEFDAIAPIALEEPLDDEEEVGPDRLRAEIAAPNAAEQRIGEKQRERGEDQQAGEVIDLLRPQFDEEEIEPRMREVDKHRLVRRVRPAIPSDKRQEIIDPQAEDQQNPFYPAEGSADLLRINLLRRRVEGTLVENLMRAPNLGCCH